MSDNDEFEKFLTERLKHGNKNSGTEKLLQGYKRNV